MKGNSDADVGSIVKLAEKTNIDVIPLSSEKIEDLRLPHIMRNVCEEGFADRTQTLEKIGL